MTVLSDLATTMQTLLTTEADDAARASGAVRRVRQFSGATLVQTLVLGWLHQPHASVDALTDLAAERGVLVTPQALDQRLTPATGQCLSQVLRAALQRVVAATPAALPLLQRFQGVYVFDTTTVGLPAALADVYPGCGGGPRPGVGLASLKIHACLELSQGTLELDFGPGRQPDVSSPLARGPLPAGALRLADRGFFDLGVLQDYTEQGVSWITRVPARLLVQPDGDVKQALPAFLAAQTTDQLDLPVRVGKDGQLVCRLLARRAPPAVVAQRQAQLRRQAQKKGRRISDGQLSLCGWTVYLTNLSAEQLRWEELWVLARARWQIELLFKLWKSHGGLAVALGHRDDRVVCELYAKLIGQVVQHWLLLCCAGPCLAYSYPKAARRVRRLVPLLASVLTTLTALVQALECLRQRLQQRCRVQRRGRRPTTYDLLRDPDQPLPTDELDEEDLQLCAA